MYFSWENLSCFSCFLLCLRINSIRSAPAARQILVDTKGSGKRFLNPLSNKGYSPCLPGWLGTQLHGRIVLGMTIVVRATHFGHGLHAGTRPTDPIPIGRYPLFKRANLGPRSVSVARNEKDKVTGIEVKAAVLKPNGKQDARLVYFRLQKHRMKKISEAAFGASREPRWISVTSLWLNLCQICHTA